MTRAELAYSFVEDDFLFSKLGNTKPFCAPVVCNVAIAEKILNCRQIVTGL